MPAKSEKQRRLMAMAEHSPEKVSKKNRGVLSMSKAQLHEFASTGHSAMNQAHSKVKRQRMK